MKNITFAVFSYATKKQAFVLLAKATPGKLTIKLIRKKNIYPAFYVQLWEIRTKTKKRHQEGLNKKSAFILAAIL